MKKSDWSGRLVDADQERHVVLRLPNGRERRLTVTEEDLATLEDRGIAWGRSWRRLAAWIANPRFWLLVASTYVLSVVLPAVTSQWADREADARIKGELIRVISREAVILVSGAQEAMFAPERRKTTSKLLDSWTETRATLDPLFDLYFGVEAEVSDEWFGYARAINDYITLSCCHRRDRVSIVDRLSDHAPIDIPDASLQILQEPPGQEPSEEFATVYDILAREILSFRIHLLRQLRYADSIPFSTTPTDLFKAVTFDCLWRCE